VKFPQWTELLPALISGGSRFARLSAPGYEIASFDGLPTEAVAQIAGCALPGPRS